MASLVLLKFTLSQFAENSAHNLDSNITLFIIGGNHDLDNEMLLSNKEQISILLVNDSIEGPVVACSTHNARFSLVGSSHVLIRGIEFVGCDGNIIMLCFVVSRLAIHVYPLYASVYGNYYRN